MGGMGSGRTASAKAARDWFALYAKFVAEYEPLGRTQKEFAQDHGVEPQTVSAWFKRIKRDEILKVAHKRNQPLLLKSQKRIEEALDAPNVEPDFALRVFKETWSREEPDPKASNTNILVVPPLFASPAAQMAIQSLTQAPPELGVPSAQSEALAALTVGDAPAE